MADCIKIVKEAAEALGFTQAKNKKFAYGQKEGYQFLIEAVKEQNSREQDVVVSYCVRKDNSAFDTSLLKTEPIMAGVGYFQDRCKVNLRLSVKGKNDENVVKLISIVQKVVHILSLNGYVNCDMQGVVGATKIYKINDNYLFLTDETNNEMQTALTRKKDEADSVKERRVLGMAGAILGAIAGGLLTLIIARFGIISTISTIVTGVAVAGLYQKFAKKMSVFGVIVCTVVAAIFTYLVFRIDVGIDIYQAMQDMGVNMPYGECFGNAKDIMELADGMGTYYRNMILMMLVSVLGALVCSGMMYLEQRNRYEMKVLE